MILFLVPWVLLLITHKRKKRQVSMIALAREEKNTVMLALNEEGKSLRSKMRANNGEQYMNPYAREKRFERVAILA